MNLILNHLIELKKDLVNSVHDISNGGLIIALAEMSMGSNYGIKINKTRIDVIVDAWRGR